jgi:sec-independent protein translocase protein TatC
MLNSHLREVSLRFIYLFSSFCLTFLIGYIYCNQVLYICVETFLRLTNVLHLNYLGLWDILIVYIKLAFIFAFVLQLPLLIYHFISYLSAGFLKYEFVLACKVLLFWLLSVTIYLIILSLCVLPILFKLVVLYENVGVSGVLKLRYEVFLNNYITLVYILVFYSLILVVFPSLLI